MKKLKSLIGLSLAASLPLTAGLMGTNHVNLNNKQNLKTFNGYFPGMGPFGNVGDQDRGKEKGYSDVSWDEIGWIKLDLSTTSIDWINTHYTGPGTKGDTVWYGIYDFLTDAYPKGNFTDFLNNFKSSPHTPSINTVFKTLSDAIGLAPYAHNNTLDDSFGIGFEIIWSVNLAWIVHSEWKVFPNRPI